MAMGIPVIASPVGENSYLIEEGKDGFFAGNGLEWYGKISFLIENEKERKMMGIRGADKVKQLYSLSLWAKKIAEIFKSMV